MCVLRAVCERGCVCGVYECGGAYEQTFGRVKRPNEARLLSGTVARTGGRSALLRPAPVCV